MLVAWRLTATVPQLWQHVQVRWPLTADCSKDRTASQRNITLGLFHRILNLWIDWHSIYQTTQCCIPEDGHLHIQISFLLSWSRMYAGLLSALSVDCKVWLCQYVTLWHVLFRYHGPQGFPGWGTDHEEAAAPKADPTVCSVYHGGTNIHHHRTHEERQSAGVPAGFVPLTMFVCLIRI